MRVGQRLQIAEDIISIFYVYFIEIDSCKPIPHIKLKADSSGHGVSEALDPAVGIIVDSDRIVVSIVDGSQLADGVIVVGVADVIAVGDGSRKKGSHLFFGLCRAASPKVSDIYAEQLLQRFNEVLAAVGLTLLQSAGNLICNFFFFVSILFKKISVSLPFVFNEDLIAQ